MRVNVSTKGTPQHGKTMEGSKLPQVIRKEVSTNLRMRHAPEFSFEYDNSIERGAELLQLIDQVSKDS